MCFDTLSPNISLMHFSTSALAVVQQRKPKLLWKDTCPCAWQECNLVKLACCNNWFFFSSLGKITKPEDFDKYIIPNQTAGGHSCSLCLQFTHVAKSNVRNHVESRHFPNSFVYNCDHCGHNLGTKKALQRHKARCKSGQTSMQQQNFLYWLVQVWIKCELIWTAEYSFIPSFRNSVSWGLQTVHHHNWKRQNMQHLPWVLSQIGVQCEKSYWEQAFSKQFCVLLCCLWNKCGNKDGVGQAHDTTQEQQVIAIRSTRELLCK